MCNNYKNNESRSSLACVIGKTFEILIDRAVSGMRKFTLI